MRSFQDKEPAVYTSSEYFLIPTNNESQNITVKDNTQMFSATAV